MEKAQEKYNELLKHVRAGEHVGKDELDNLGKMAGRSDSEVEKDLASARNANFCDLHYE